MILFQTAEILNLQRYTRS